MINEINTPEKLYQYMKENIEYGFINRYSTKYLRSVVDANVYMNNIFNNYRLQSPMEVYKNRCGICFDQVAFAKEILLNNGIDVETFYTKIHNHVFLVYKYNYRYYYFERSFPHHNGIMGFDTLEELFRYYLSIQEDTKLNEVAFFQFNKVIYGCDFDEYIDNIMKQNNVRMILKRN